jgi:hypothetical protein
MKLKREKITLKLENKLDNVQRKVDKIIEAKIVDKEIEPNEINKF